MQINFDFIYFYFNLYTATVILILTLIVILVVMIAGRKEWYFLSKNYLYIIFYFYSRLSK